VREINQVTCGWGNYFALAHRHRSFRAMNEFIAHRLRQWLWRKHGSPWGKYDRWPNRKLFTTSGSTNWTEKSRIVPGTRKAGCGKTARPV
jgi:RNA-directed DNA polymerase